MQTESDCIEHQARSGFSRAFRRIAEVKRIRYCSSPRGYYVKIPKFSRNLTNIRGQIDLDDKVFERKFVDRIKGYGVFALCDIPKDYVLIEYRGQWVEKSEYHTREKYYESRKLSPVAVFDKNKFLDANRDIDGKLFKTDENIARYFNHSRSSPNCKLIGMETGDEVGVKKLFLKTKCAVPKGMELVWDYGETKKDIVVDNPWLNC